MKNYQNCNEVSGGILNTVPLNEAASTGDLELVNRLLSEGAFPDGKDETAITPLMEAAREGHSEIVERLLLAGAKVNRMGFVQRFYPLDFANWIKSDSKTINLLRKAGGRKVDDTIDWEAQPGYPIISHVSNRFAAVYPEPFHRSVNDLNINVWLGKVRENSDLVYLFTSSLHENFSNTEIGLLVPLEWSLLDLYINEKSIYSFPIDFIHQLSLRIADSEHITEGHIIQKTDQDFRDLSWPENTNYMVAIDHTWGGDLPRGDTSESENEVKIYTYAPVSTKSFKPSEKSGRAYSEKLRSAKARKLALPYYWKDRL